MPSADIAERLLALFAEPSVAASITGDLLEQSAGQSPAWFWRRVLRTTLSMLFQGFRPSGSVRLWDNVSRAVGYGVAFEAALIWFFPLGLPNSWAHRHGSVLMRLLFLQMALNAYLMGRFAAKRSPEREIPAGLALAMQLALILSIACIEHFGDLPVAVCLICLPAVAGAFTVRVKRIRHA
jgi:hypothetical protein